VSWEQARRWIYGATILGLLIVLARRDDPTRPVERGLFSRILGKMGLRHRAADHWITSFPFEK
jgi:hypothetical protein